MAKLSENELKSGQHSSRLGLPKVFGAYPLALNLITIFLKKRFDIQFFFLFVGGRTANRGTYWTVERKFLPYSSLADVVKAQVFSTL